MTTTRLGLCAALLIPLCGCFDISEEVTVHANGQGTHRMEQRVHDVGEFMGEEEVEELQRELAEAVAELEALPEVVSAEGGAKLDDADLVVHVAYTVGDFKDLGRVGNQAHGRALEIAEDHDLGGMFRFEELGQGRWRWSYPLYDEGQLAARTEARARARQAKRAVASGKSPEETQALLDEELREGSLTYRFRAPQVFVAEGAELDGGEACWSYPLDPMDDLDVPESLSAEFSLSAPFPWSYALIGGGLSFGLVGGLWLRRKWAKRWE